MAFQGVSLRYRPDTPSVLNRVTFTAEGETGGPSPLQRMSEPSPNDVRGSSTPPHLHTSTPPHLHTSTPPHLLTSTPYTFTPPHLPPGLSPTHPPLPLGLSLTHRPLLPPAGAKLGVVGRSGAGKSSLLAALFRTVEPHEGRLVVDGVDVLGLPLQLLR